MMEESANTFSIIVTAITPIVLGILTLFQVKREKRTKEFHQMQKELEDSRAEREQKKEKEHEERLQRMETSINGVTETVKELQESLDIGQMETQLERLHVMTELNFSYIQSLSNTVIVIGDALASSDVMDKDSSDKLDQALTANRQMEEEISKNLLKILN